MSTCRSITDRVRLLYILHMLLLKAGCRDPSHGARRNGFTPLVP
jgi:hypothetical protein